MSADPTTSLLRRSKKRSIYLLPNLLTTVGLFAGFYAVVAAMKGYFSDAAIAIFIAMIADGLDGRVARLTNTESDFGGQYDSLSDMVAFGVAPALVVYSWALMTLGKLGWLAAFLYTAGTALRLARFNAESSVVADKQFFKGLPSPAAAGFIAGMVWLGRELGFNVHDFALAIGLLTVLIGCLMVSNFRYYSFKKFDFKNHVPFVAMVIVVAIFVFISVDPPSVLFFLFFVYAFSGPVMSFIIWRQARKKRILFRKKNNL